MTDRFQVLHRPDESRYVLVDHEASERVIGEEAYVDVEAEGNIQRVLFHTDVADDYGGRGLASLLVRHVVEDVVDAGHAVVPVCPYVAGWLPRHPEYDGHVVKLRPAHLRAVTEQRRGENDTSSS